MLNKVSSEKWCVLVVTSRTEYLQPVKTIVGNCIGSERDALETGVHFYVEVGYVFIYCTNM